jgi:hypothetical protein
MNLEGVTLSSLIVTEDFIGKKDVEFRISNGKSGGFLNHISGFEFQQNL